MRLFSHHFQESIKQSGHRYIVSTMNTYAVRRHKRCPDVRWGSNMYMRLITNHRSLSVNRNQTLCYVSVESGGACVNRLLPVIRMYYTLKLHSNQLWKIARQTQSNNTCVNSVKLCLKPDQTWRLHIEPIFTAVTHHSLPRHDISITILQGNQCVSPMKGNQCRLSVEHSTRTMNMNSNKSSTPENRIKLMKNTNR